MNQPATREILWNVPGAFGIFLYTILVPLAAAFVREGKRRYRIAEAAGFFGFPYYRGA
jgi:hypothetical protein